MREAAGLTRCMPELGDAQIAGLTSRTTLKLQASEFVIAGTMHDVNVGVLVGTVGVHSALDTQILYINMLRSLTVETHPV
jgi:hypothetical protein